MKIKVGEGLRGKNKQHFVVHKMFGGEGLGGKNKQQAPNMSRRAPHWAL